MMAALGILTKLLCLLSLLLCAVQRAQSYYEIVPYVTFTSSAGGYRKSFGGSYASYAAGNEAEGRLVLAPASHFDCGDSASAADNSTLTSFSGSVLLLELTGCSDYIQAVKASQLGCSGIVFYYISDGEQGGRTALGYRPDGDFILKSLSVALVSLRRSELNELAVELDSEYDVVATIEPHQQQAFQTTHTFYFVVFAFTILMLLSCLWFVTSYVRRCRNTIRNRRRLVQNQRVTHQAINKLELRTHKVPKGSKEVEDSMCAICLDAYAHNDTLRVLPCKHEYHKKCIDPWLKLKRACPVCKQGITARSSREKETRSSSHGRAREPRDMGRSSSESAPLRPDSLSQSTVESEMEEGRFTSGVERVVFLEGAEERGREADSVFGASAEEAIEEEEEAQLPGTVVLELEEAAEPLPFSL